MTVVPDALTVGEATRARIGVWPYEPGVAQIVLLDHSMVPTVDAVLEWVRQARRQGATTVRTGAMFPAAAAVFVAAGFDTIDTLALLQTSLEERPRSSRRHPSAGARAMPDDLTPADASHRVGRPRGLRSAHLPEAALLDRAAFGDPWGNDATTLADIADATPHSRARRVTARLGTEPSTLGSTRLAGFAISGHSGSCGYLQRLAVHPAVRRQGVARLLVADALQWMRRRGATTAMVNTALDNEAALALYGSMGFVRRSDTLTILESILSDSSDDDSSDSDGADTVHRDPAER